MRPSWGQSVPLKCLSPPFGLRIGTPLAFSFLMPDPPALALFLSFYLFYERLFSIDGGAPLKTTMATPFEVYPCGLRRRFFLCDRLLYLPLLVLPDLARMQICPPAPLTGDCARADA